MMKITFFAMLCTGVDGFQSNSDVKCDPRWCARRYRGRDQASNRRRCERGQNVKGARSFRGRCPPAKEPEVVFGRNGLEFAFLCQNDETLTRDQCKDRPNCYWDQTFNQQQDGGSCLVNDCENYDEDQCGKNPVCVWNQTPSGMTDEEAGDFFGEGGHCTYVACYLFGTEEECAKEEICSWTTYDAARVDAQGITCTEDDESPAEPFCALDLNSVNANDDDDNNNNINDLCESNYFNWYCTSEQNYYNSFLCWSHQEYELECNSIADICKPDESFIGGNVTIICNCDDPSVLATVQTVSQTGEQIDIDVACSEQCNRKP